MGNSRSPLALVKKKTGLSVVALTPFASVMLPLRSLSPPYRQYSGQRDYVVLGKATKQETGRAATGEMERRRGVRPLGPLSDSGG